jgi:hypothetical protein
MSTYSENEESPSTAFPTTSNPSGQSPITQKSHRLRTSPVLGEGSTYVPVVKFHQPFTQRNAIHAIKPIYGSVPSLNDLSDADIVSFPSPLPQQTQSPTSPRRPTDLALEARAQGWTISITSSNHTDEELQVEVQQHFEPPIIIPRPDRIQVEETLRRQEERKPIGLLGGAEPIAPSARPIVQPRISPPTLPQIPTLAHDRALITKDDLSRLRIKSVTLLLVGVIFPPVWVLVGWSHVLDPVILPPTGSTAAQHQILDIYRPYRNTAGILAGVAVLGTFVGIIIGALALGGVIA